MPHIGLTGPNIHGLSSINKAAVSFIIFTNVLQLKQLQPDFQYRCLILHRQLLSALNLTLLYTHPFSSTISISTFYSFVSPRRFFSFSPQIPIYLTHIPTLTMPGFDFSNHNRNIALHAQGVPLPKATSTGTTIVGCLFDGGVVIAADTRATSGPIVADKASSCLHLPFSIFY